MAAMFVANATRKAPGLIATRSVAWTKFLGNLFMSVFVYMHHPQSHFLHYLTYAVLLLNVVYIIQATRKKRKDRLASE
jgi:hypothetical protein